jgi:hypothetical protein
MPSVLVVTDPIRWATSTTAIIEAHDGSVDVDREGGRERERTLRVNPLRRATPVGPNIPQYADKADEADKADVGIQYIPHFSIHD